MTKHSLKIHPQYYAAVADGSKTFELRKNDRGFQKGDEVALREWDPEPVEKEGAPPELLSLTSQSPRTHFEPYGYTTSPILKFKIGYVLPIDAERVVFSLLPKEG